MVSRITSIKDERVVQARALTTAAGRNAAKKCQLQGVEQIRWGMDAGIPIEHIFMDESAAEDCLIKEFNDRNLNSYVVSQGILKKITETNYCIPFVAIADLGSLVNGELTKADMIIVLDQVRDQGNIGTIVRTAMAFGVNELVTTSPEVDFFYKKTIDASRGRVFHAHIHRYDSVEHTVSVLKNAGFQIVATSPHASRLQAQLPIIKKKVALVLGNETTGISEELLKVADTIVQIPMSGAVESLNVAVAGGVSIYEIKLRLLLAMLTEKILGAFGRTVNITAKYIQSAFDTFLRTITHFSATQVIFMMILRCDEWMTFEQVSKDVAAWGNELEALLQPLVEAQFIEYEKRNGVKGVKLTTKGEQFLATIMLASEKFDQQLFVGFSEQDKQQLLVYLEQIQQNCKQIIESKDQ